MMAIYAKTVFVLLVFRSLFISCDTIFTFTGNNATLPCSSNIQYPKWNGPSSIGNIDFNYGGNEDFANPALGEKQTRLSWGQNLRDLIIKDTILGDEGNYTCIGTGTVDSAELIVIVPPQTPAISNIVKLENNLEVVYDIEGQPLTITCTSRGGYPAPTVVWYKDSISNSNQMTSTSTGTLQSDGTYTVTLQHTFTPTASEDRKTLICRSYYPQADSADRGSKTKSVILYLALKPSQPTVTQTSVVNTGNTVEVSCRTTGSRPAASISWLYQGSSSKGIENTTLDATTETFSVVSLFRRQVTAVDNGRDVQCKVSHQALVNMQTVSVKLNVRFSVGPSTTRITGNKEMIATGQTALTLTCTTGSSNPASYITWKNDSVTLTSSRPYTSSSGDNNGFVRSQQLILYPTRYMDGDVITCSVLNTVSTSAVVDSVTLNLKYSPLVSIQGQQQNTVTEGETKELYCKVDSKPSSTITWYHGNSMILQKTPVSNVLNYSLTSVNRTHYGDYTCKANNGIGPEHEGQISVTVRFKPLTTVITGNSNIIANGKNTLSLVCTSGSSNPKSDITWRINNVITAPTGSLSDLSGNYGGMERRQRLTLTPTRDNDGDSISCEAHNSIGSSDRSKVTLDLRYRPLIEPMPDVVAVEGNNTILTCVAFSKPVSTFKWYREGHSGVLYQGTGTLGSNKLTYTINKVRRTDAATYRCNADNRVETADNKNVLITVYYPPDVTAMTSNTTVKALNAVLACNARGVPNNNYKYGKWIQTWSGYGVPVSEKPGNEKLVLTHLTYEHSGVYTCSASNGIKIFGTNKEFMEGSVLLVVKSFPIITQFHDKTPAKLKENVTVDIDYYSNAASSDVRIFRNVTGNRRAGVFYTVSEANVDVDLPVFTHVIKTIGLRASIMIHIQSKNDFGFYDVVVSNEIDSSTKTFEIVPEGPPSGAYNISVDDIQGNTARVSWSRGYHGGLAQTFLIQLSIDKTKWENVETVYAGKDEGEDRMYKDLTGLHESTTYYVRMYAFNSEGNSPFSEYHNFTTTSVIEAQENRSAGVAGIVGGVTSAVVVIIVIVAIVVMVRKNIITKEKFRSKVQTAVSFVGIKQQQSDVNEQDVSVREMYEDLQHSTASANTHVYDVMKVDHEVPDSSRNQYENLPKKKSTSSNTKSKGKQDSGKTRIYENLKLRQEKAPRK